jgi:hypothetical protein
MEVVTLIESRGTIVADGIGKSFDKSIYYLHIGTSVMLIDKDLIAHCSADEKGGNFNK